MGIVDGREVVCDKRGDRGIWEFSGLSAHCCCEPKTAEKKKKRPLVNIQHKEQTIHNLKVLWSYGYDKDDSTVTELPVFYPYSVKLGSRFLKRTKTYMPQVSHLEHPIEVTT